MTGSTDQIVKLRKPHSYPKKTSAGSPSPTPAHPSRRRSSMTTRASTAALIESFRVAMEDFDETKQERKGELRDVLGHCLANAINNNPNFRRPTNWKIHQEINDFNAHSPTFQPLISSRNLRWIKRQYGTLKTNLMMQKNKNIFESTGRVWTYAFENARSPIQALASLVSMLLVYLFVVSVGSTVLVIWNLQFLRIICFGLSAVLVDWSEMERSLPVRLRFHFRQIAPALNWFDDFVLWGQRHKGREWNKSRFELEDSKSAKSFSTYLHQLPPPIARGRGSASVSKEEIRQNNWSLETSNHIDAINFTYFMLREDFVRRKFARLRKAVFKRKSPQSVRKSSDETGDSSNIIQLGLPASPLPNPANVNPIKQEADTVDSGMISAEANGISCDSDIPIDQLTIEHLEDGRVDLSALNRILGEDDDSMEGETSHFEAQDIHETNSDSAMEMGWMDVGAEIGMKILGSAAVQKAMTSHDTAERLVSMRENMAKTKGVDSDPTQNKVRDLAMVSPVEKEKALTASLRPVHSMWTSASAAAGDMMCSPTQTLEITSSGESEIQILQTSRSRETNLPFLDPFIDTRCIQEECGPSLMGSEMPASAPGALGESVLSPFFPGNKINEESIELVRETKRTRSPNVENQKHAMRMPLLPGVKIAVPIFPFRPGKISSKARDLSYQMATVVTSKRICIYQEKQLPPSATRTTNCLSITVQLDKSFLRNGKFAEMNLRIMDEWSDRYMPKHSKLPLGSCVSTSFGVGVLVGWRVEDDCHVVRSLWQRRGAGSACAYLQRNAIRCTVEAAVGFEVETTAGQGEVVGCIGGGGVSFESGRYVVSIPNDEKPSSSTIELSRKDILACKSARFIPVIEHVKEAVQYQLQLDTYNATMKNQETESTKDYLDRKTWKNLSKYSDILWKSFLRATEEDDDFDDGMNAFVASVVNFFDRLDTPQGTMDSKGNDSANIVITATDSTHPTRQINLDTNEAGFWFMSDIFGLFGTKDRGHSEPESHESIEVECTVDKSSDDASIQRTYDRAFAIIRTLMRTISIARAGCKDEPEFKLALSITYDFLVFLKTVVKVQQKNVSPKSLQIWRRAWEEIVSTFGPVKERLQKIGQGIAERMEKQGRRAKIRLLRFVDTVVEDEILLMSLERGEWMVFVERLEDALVKAKIIDEESREHYHKTAHFMYNHFASVAASNRSAAARNNEKLANLAVMIQWIAAPRRSALRILIQNSVLDVLERVLVRVFYEEDVASQMLSIHASNFHTLRQFRMLKDFTIAGKFWMPLLDAADAELVWMASKMHPNVKEYMGPISSLFSLCVAQFHKISDGDLTKDWLDFLMEDDAVSIIHEIDMKLILALESFSRDVKEMMVVLPYYPSIEDDILNLVDEVDIDEFLREASEAVDDQQKLNDFVREKATIAIERFLDYLPKMSIPVEKRDLADGWVLTCRGADGGDLTLTDLSIQRENLTCQVMGGDTLFFPMLGTDEEDCKSEVSIPEDTDTQGYYEGESSVLDHIRDMIITAQKYGCWQQGVGGVNQPPTDRYVASILHGLPVSSVLNCGIELWRNLEIDDDELLEIAIRDVSYQIQIQETTTSSTLEVLSEPTFMAKRSASKQNVHRFNPRTDPSVLYLEIQKLTFCLDKFLFRIEKHEDRRTVFDPIFEGSGSLMVRNVSIKLRVECVKEYSNQMGRRKAVPLLQIRELEVNLERVKLKVKNTGADWLLNKVVKSFEDNITHILATNLNEQVREQMELALENLNGYFAVNPELVLGMLDITIDDLEEKVVWV